MTRNVKSYSDILVMSLELFPFLIPPSYFTDVGTISFGAASLKKALRNSMLWFHQSPFIVLVCGVEVLETGRGAGRSRVYNRSLLKRQVQYNQVYAN